MSKVKKSAKKKVAKVAGSKAPKKVKFELVSYSVKAVIPTGAYANIQPEITIKAPTIEQAERIVMPFIEALFTKYRNDGSVSSTVVTTPIKTITTQPAQAQKAPATPVQATAQAKVATGTPAGAAVAEPKAPEAPAPAAVVMNAPFEKAQKAVESCVSKEALKLISEKITKSDKLTQTEKNTLTMMVSDKMQTLNG